jgi:excisionase family DNA binding protein
VTRTHDGLTATTPLLVFLVFGRDTRKMTANLMTTGEAARRLGVSRQQVVNLCERGALRYVRVGTHRRIPSAEVARLSGGLTYEQERSLWLHQALLGELLARPDEVLAHAAENVTRWRSKHRADGMAVQWLDAWDRTLQAGVDQVVETLTGRDQLSCELRQNSPFAGVLPPQTRQQVLRSFKRHWERQHAAVAS